MNGQAVLKEQELLAQTVERAKSGCRDAFDSLIRRFEANVMKTALYLTRNLDDAQDVAQEVYVKIFRHLQSCEAPDRMEHWVYRVTVNAARDFLRRKKFFLPIRVVFRTVSPRDPVFRQEIRNRLTDAISLLSFNERAAFIFTYLEEMDTAEVAEILGCRVGTVRSHLHSARKKLQPHFRDFHESLWTD